MGVQSIAGQGAQMPDPGLVAQTPPSRDGPESAPTREAQSAPVPVRIEAPKAPEASKPIEPHPAPQRGGTRMRVDSATKRLVTQIVDEMDQVIKQIPPEELLRIVARTRDLQALLFDERV
jgi:uncharacterized FlaG/YvyC family protein